MHDTESIRDRDDEGLWTGAADNGWDAERGHPTHTTFRIDDLLDEILDGDDDADGDGIHGDGGDDRFMTDGWDPERATADRTADLGEILEWQHYVEPEPEPEPSPVAGPRRRRRPARPRTRPPRPRPATDEDGAPLPHPAPISAAEAGRLLHGEATRLRTLRAGLLAELEDGSPADDRGAAGPLGLHPADLASDTYQREVDESLLAAVDDELAEVDAALRRLAGHRYGTCERCGRPIAPERLRAEPATRWCGAEDGAGEGVVAGLA